MQIFVKTLMVKQLRLKLNLLILLIILKLDLRQRRYSTCLTTSNFREEQLKVVVLYLIIIFKRNRPFITILRLRGGKINLYQIDINQDYLHLIFLTYYFHTYIVLRFLMLLTSHLENHLMHCRLNFLVFAKYLNKHLALTL